jgi:hypothetical protein
LSIVIIKVRDSLSRIRKLFVKVVDLSDLLSRIRKLFVKVVDLSLELLPFSKPSPGLGDGEGLG